MLVFSRKQGQSFFIGESLVKIEKLKGNIVRISVDAPKEIKVLRSELKERSAKCPPNTNDGQRRELE